MTELPVKSLVRNDGLRLALARGEFEVFYQPKVSCLSGAIVGVEALVRWRHPDCGLIAPAEFIPSLERLNLIEPLGTWVLMEACAQTGRWQAAGLEPPVVAVNLSARQFESGALVERVLQAVSAGTIAPDRLELELTESLLMRHVDDVVHTLAQLHEHGVRLSVDDFGTGYSSLAYLKQFPLDAVKIDRSFIRDITADPNDASITRAIITMAHQLKLKVIAEGVETEGQLKLLVANQCDEIQGYFFSRPVPAGEMEAMLRDKRCLAQELLSSRQRQRTILIVDDEQPIINALCRLLRQDGYSILCAAHAMEGLEILAKNEVDVVLSDQRMPGMTGVEFLRRVKSIHPGTVRMVLSGYADLQSVTDAINEGAIYKYITKPWDRDRLRGLVQEAFRQKEQADDSRIGVAVPALVDAGTTQARTRSGHLPPIHKECSAGDEPKAMSAQDVLGELGFPIIGIGPQGTVVYANQEAHSALGAQETLCGRSAAEVLPGALALRAGGARRRETSWQGTQAAYRVLLRPMSLPGYAGGTLLVLLPQAETGG
jgi:EAL domain-containing protein (putative c-di-GMP-specific phosphodiesterase class I)/CheY-like chemotaxis protein